MASITITMGMGAARQALFSLRKERAIINARLTFDNAGSFIGRGHVLADLEEAIANLEVVVRNQINRGA